MNQDIISAPISAGGFVVRRSGARHDALIARQEGVWRAPKGMQSPGESLRATAIREILEETGILGVALNHLTTERWTYSYRGTQCSETCHFFLLAEAGAPAVSFDGEETDEISWVPLEDVPDILHYHEEARTAQLALDLLLREPEVLDWRIPFGVSSGRRRASGSLVVGVSQARKLMESDEKNVIVAVQGTSPADVPWMNLCSGLLTGTGGPTSHTVVVAAALGIACLTASGDVGMAQGQLEVGNCAVPTGALITIDESAGVVVPSHPNGGQTERVVASTTDPREALEWASTVSARLGLPEPTNWKIFKHDLAARFLPVPESRRFLVPWRDADVLAHAEVLAAPAVRCSVYPRDIACHARGVLLDESSRESWSGLIASIDHSCDLELFVPQGSEKLCWRLVCNNGISTLEAGIGQANTIFEDQRCDHALVGFQFRENEWFPLGHYALGSPEMLLAGGFLRSCGDEVITRMMEATEQLEIDLIAVEGYFDVEVHSFVVTDIDLPQDQAFMAAK